MHTHTYINKYCCMCKNTFICVYVCIHIYTLICAFIFVWSYVCLIRCCFWQNCPHIFQTQKLSPPTVVIIYPGHYLDGWMGRTAPCFTRKTSAIPVTHSLILFKEILTCFHPPLSRVGGSISRWPSTASRSLNSPLCWNSHHHFVLL